MPDPWWRRSSTLAVGSSALALVVLVVAAFVALRPDSTPAAAEPGPTRTIPLTTGASPTASATATVTPTPRVTHTQVPIPTVRASEPAPPPPPPAPAGPPPSDPPSCTQWNPAGDASRETVQAALAAAGGREQWRTGVREPKGWPGGPYPSITVPANLMYAVAWTESDWRSTVIACDGGIGLMQLMPDNVDFLNDRFGRSYDPFTVNGNASLGAAYLEWLTMYFGLYYFGSFDLETVAPLREDGGNIKLGDVVIAAYNVGFGNVENLHGTVESADDTLSIPNQWYVDRVRRFQSQKPWETPLAAPPATSAAPTAG